MRLILALQCFFAVLFGRAVPAKALPGPGPGVGPGADDAARQARALEEARARVTALEAELAAARAKPQDQAGTGLGAAGDLAVARAERDAAQGERDAAQEGRAKAEAAAAKAEAARAEAAAEAEELRKKLADARAAEEAARARLGAARDEGALAVFAWFQREGRLVDFCMESIDAYEDAQVGAAARAIHRGCRKVLDEALALEAVLPGEEQARVEVPVGFDPVAIALTGNVRGAPPFHGTLVHHGWRTARVAVPVAEQVDARVLAPAEVEL